MKNFKRLFAGGVLVLALGLPVVAGQIPCGVTDPPPPPQVAAAASTDKTGSVLIEAVVALLLFVL